MTRVVGMRSLISCMTRNIPYKIVLFIRNIILFFMYVISCAFRRGIAHVGNSILLLPISSSWSREVLLKRFPLEGHYKDLSEACPCCQASESTACPPIGKEERDEGATIKDSRCRVIRFFRLDRISQ